MQRSLETISAILSYATDQSLGCLDDLVLLEVIDELLDAVVDGRGVGVDVCLWLLRSLVRRGDASEVCAALMSLW